MNICSRFSSNAGAKWSAELQINDDTTNDNSHFLPRIAVDPTTGSLAVCWEDCRNDDGNMNGIAVAIPASTNFFTNIFDVDGVPNDDFMPYGTISLTGGASYVANIPLISTNVTAASAPGGMAVYVSEAAKAANAAGIGHHLALAYNSGNVYPVWPDNSGDIAGNPASPGFDLCLSLNAQLPTANLGIFVTNFPVAPISDEILAYTNIVTNFGPFAATSLSITNTLLANATFAGVQVAS
jgi:hypothetical protein